MTATQDFIVHELGDQLNRKLTYPTSGGKMGDPCVVGDRPGILYSDQDTAGYAVVKFHGSFRVLVHGVLASSNSAVAIGDALYYDPSPGSTNPNINKDVTNGVRWGTAVEAVVSAAKTVIVVDLNS